MGMSGRAIKRGPGKRWVEGKSLHVADEVRYIQKKAANHDSRVIGLGQLILFSTETGDAWLLDVSDQLAVRVARDGSPEPIQLEESDSNFAIGWKGNYRIHGPAFIYIERETGRVTTILGYPTQAIAEAV
jgi:hypothetical protein